MVVYLSWVSAMKTDSGGLICKGIYWRDIRGWRELEMGTRNGPRSAEVLVKKAVGERGKGPSVSFFLIDNLCEHGHVISHPRPPVSHPGVESQRARPVRSRSGVLAAEWSAQPFCCS